MSSLKKDSDIVKRANVIDKMDYAQLTASEMNIFNIMAHKLLVTYSDLSESVDRPFVDFDNENIKTYMTAGNRTRSRFIGNVESMFKKLNSHLWTDSFKYNDVEYDRQFVAFTDLITRKNSSELPDDVFARIYVNKTFAQLFISTFLENRYTSYPLKDITITVTNKHTKILYDFLSERKNLSVVNVRLDVFKRRIGMAESTPTKKIKDKILTQENMDELRNVFPGLSYEFQRKEHGEITNILFKWDKIGKSEIEVPKKLGKNDDNFEQTFIPLLDDNIDIMDVDVLKIEGGEN